MHKYSLALLVQTLYRSLQVDHLRRSPIDLLPKMEDHKAHFSNSSAFTKPHYSIRGKESHVPINVNSHYHPTYCRCRFIAHTADSSACPLSTPSPANTNLPTDVISYKDIDESLT